jgi:OmpA-OmpF porin, OOP family
MALKTCSNVMEDIMNRLCVAVVILAISVLPLAGQDVEGSKDHPLLSRMPGYHIRGYEQSDFDNHEFTVKDGNKTAIEGRRTVINYEVNEGAKQATPLQIFRNCQNALAKNGGKVVYDVIEQNAFGTTTISLIGPGQETWVEVTAGNKGEVYDVYIVEKKAMNQDVVSAENWRNEIGATGHTAVYGIYFDTDKAVLKPESKAALEEITKLLKQDASLALFVVGHTDSSGEIGHNMQLSEARAKAVVASLTATYGIAASRLSAYGVGPLSPVAPNDTDAGKARNRRVELVKR